MRKYIYIVFFFGISFFMKGQNSNLNVVNKKIESQFSKPVVIAYQNQAEKAIVDFYNYLNLYQLTTHDEAEIVIPIVPLNIFFLAIMSLDNKGLKSEYLFVKELKSKVSLLFIDFSVLKEVSKVNFKESEMGSE
ncbi:hypothetical protein FLAVO9AF_100080 [Flavobacterium sp. 9AF]|nr:hypothetical protein FLAVO9AF_100080 [Flavobacterium sp. 9AF]